MDWFRIYDLKEKDGCLDIDCNGGFGDDVTKIVEKYEYISLRTCIMCGRPAYGYTDGWITPYCEDCAEKLGVPLVPYYTEEDKWYGYYKYESKKNEETSDCDQYEQMDKIKASS